MGVPAQTPLEQTSPIVQTLLSSQGFEFATCVHPLAGLQLSSVQGLPSLQSTGAPPMQTPPEQVSFVVHALPSSHAPGTGVPPWHRPSVHDSLTVQGFASSQPALFGVCTHPVSGLQVSSVHELASSQFVGPPPEQRPLWHVSPMVHSLPSSQDPVVLRW